MFCESYIMICDTLKSAVLGIKKTDCTEDLVLFLSNLINQLELIKSLLLKEFKGVNNEDS